MKQTLLAIIATIMLASCSERQEAMQFKADSISIDTTVLRIAVMPTMSCLPVYYAEQSGLANKLGMKIQLLRFQAQMDIDTAIQRGHTDIAFTDLIRCTRLAQAKHLSNRLFLATNRYHSSHSKRNG